MKYFHKNISEIHNNSSIFQNFVNKRKLNNFYGFWKINERIREKKDRLPEYLLDSYFLTDCWNNFRKYYHAKRPFLTSLTFKEYSAFQWPSQKFVRISRHDNFWIETCCTTICRLFEALTLQRSIDCWAVVFCSEK